MKVYFEGRYYTEDSTMNEREYLKEHAYRLYCKLFPAVMPSVPLKNNLQIYQVYYDAASHAAIDGGFIPFKTGFNHNYENDIILDVWRKRDWVNAKYVGVLSWRFYEKTGLISSKLKLGSDVTVFLIKDYERFKHPFCRKGFNSVNKMVEYADKMQLFPFKLKEYPLKDNVWCNYWVAKPHIFDDYCTRYLSKAIEFFKNTDYYCITERHRGKDCLSMTFFLEGLFSIYLQEEKIKYKLVK